MIANRAEGSKRKAKKRHLSKSAQKKERLMIKNQEDIDEKLYPLSYYMHNREEMLNQAFAAIGKKDLKALLFPAIEHLPLDELKELCLGQLQEMSDRDIVLVLEGKKLTSSWISPCDAGDKHSDTEKLCFKEEKASTSKNRDDVMSTKKLHEENLASTTRDLLQCASSEATFCNINCETEKCENCVEGNKEKIRLEVLELQMRARAIRALLQYHKNIGVINDFEKNITP